MSNIKHEIKKIKIPKDLHERTKLGVKQVKQEQTGRNHHILKSSLAASAILIGIVGLSFTPVGAAVKEAYDKIFESEKIDDPGLKAVLKDGHGQAITQTYYDKKHDITVHFENVITDNKETKLLVTFESETTNLKNYAIDLFEGFSKMYVVTDDGERKELDHIGWGSRHYDKKENKVSTALSFDSIKEYEGQAIQLEIENITIWSSQKTEKMETVWPVAFTLDKSYISDVETLVLNKEFMYENETYTIQQVEYSELETRLVITGTDMIYVDEFGDKYQTKSKLELQFLNARQINRGSGYTVAEGKSGVFLRASGERIDPNFSKGEVDSELGTFYMIFAPVEDRSNVVLEVGEDLKVSLNK
ncbi:DUF4179 domain-containing protein [Metabacillus endolithicus]|uniref:DUF4179 domain-containing protein n=1 Tax=Metabacillus endolithicus TaxID=1535204 RepID=A0ABW5BQM6_9BACI|nr:DUF4179 domain-containing protein [Metabacillus endolithicus]UPG63714.1 DUF4179 domain-containing protein [Metabacillus endolithicus]